MNVFVWFVQDAVVVKVETSFDHVWLLRDQVDKIIAATGAGIRCPDVSILKELPKKYCVWIRGSLDQVYKASTMLNVSCLFVFHFLNILANHSF